MAMLLILESSVTSEAFGFYEADMLLHKESLTCTLPAHCILLQPLLANDISNQEHHLLHYF